jgi:pilus assembly protein CpaF
LSLENVGVNSCLVGETEVLGGERVTFASSVRVRIWPYTLSFETDATVGISRQELEAHLRSLVADVELKIHQTLLERLDVYDMKATGGNDRETILLLENNIEDVCRELKLFEVHNEAVIEEIVGLSLRDYLINQLIMETGDEQVFDLAVLTTNEFDVPATLVPERETELHALLQFAREKMQLETLPDVSSKIHRVEDKVSGRVPITASSSASRVAEVHPAPHVEEGLEGHRLRVRTAAGSAARAHDQRNHGCPQRPDLRGTQRSDREIRAAFHLGQGDRIDPGTDRRPSRAPDRPQPAAGGRPAAGRFAGERHHPAAGGLRTVFDGPQVPHPADDDGRSDRMGTMSKAAATFLRASVIDRRSILISGGTGRARRRC